MERKLDDEFMQNLGKAIQDKTGLNVKMIKLKTIRSHVDYSLAKLFVFDTVKFTKIRPNDALSDDLFDGVNIIMKVAEQTQYPDVLYLEGNWFKNNTNTCLKGWQWTLYGSNDEFYEEYEKYIEDNDYWTPVP